MINVFGDRSQVCLRLQESNIYTLSCDLEGPVSERGREDNPPNSACQEAVRCHGLVSGGVWHLAWIPPEAEVCAGVWVCATSAGREPWGMKAAGGNWVCVKLSCLTKPRSIQRRQAWHLHPLCRKITDNKLCVCVWDNENWVTPAESHQKQYPTAVFPLELFSRAVKTMTEREECGDLVSLSFCSSIKDKRHFWVASRYLPTSLLQPLHTARQLFCDAFIPPLCQNPLETSLPLPVIDCHALFIAPKDRRNQHPSLTGIRCILVSLKGLTVAHTTMSCWSTDSAILSRGRFYNSVATAALQFKYKVRPMAGDHKKRGRIGMQGEVKDRQWLKKKKKKDKEWHEDLTLHL